MLPGIHSGGQMLFDPCWAEQTHTNDTSELLYVISGVLELESVSGAIKRGKASCCSFPRSLRIATFSILTRDWKSSWYPSPGRRIPIFFDW